MTRTAWFHCFSGVAGDMCLGALVDAGAELADVAAIVDGVGVGGWALTVEAVMRQGLTATRAIVVVDQGDDHHHDRDRGAHDDHAADHDHHRRYRDIRSLLDAAVLPARVRARAQATFAALAEVEGALHGVAPDDVEFHEVGSLDAIVDVVGVCAALEVLGVDEVVCSPIGVGHGTLRAAHGTLPNPAPAVASLAATRGVPIVGLDEGRELATPTGVALMATLASRFGPAPAGVVAATGLGAGTRELPARPNVVQVLIVDHDDALAPETLVELATNVDDVTGEVLAYTVARLLDTGALDAWVTPIVMKKGRPAHTLSALCRAELVDAVREVMVRETASLGVRASTVRRWAAPREVVTVDVAGHTVGVKRGPWRDKAEYDDAVAAARALGWPLHEVQAAAETAARQAPDVGPS